MSARKETKPQAPNNQTQATEHVAAAHQLLKELRERVGKHPELEQAILKLEMALNTLTVKTGGML